MYRFHIFIFVLHPILFHSEGGFPLSRKNYVRKTCAKEKKKRTLAIFHFRVKINATRVFFYVHRTYVLIERQMATKSREVWFADCRSNDSRCIEAFRSPVLLTAEAKRKRKYLKRYWVREIFQNRFQLGEYQTLVKEMCKNDYESLYEYFGMTSEKFDHLLSLVGPMLWKKSLYRKPTSPDERPAVTLRFLATGDSLQTILFSYRLGPATGSRIMPEVHVWCTVECTTGIDKAALPARDFDNDVTKRRDVIRLFKTRFRDLYQFVS